MGKMVQHRKMRQLHTFGQHAGHASAGKLVYYQYFAEQRNSKVIC